MRVVRNRLTHRKAMSLGPGKYVDGLGLLLVVDKNLNRRWILRISIKGKRTDIGLGSFPIISLARARELTLECRRILAEGGDPLAIRRERKMGVSVPSFAECAKSYVEAHESAWTSRKHARQWIGSLEQHVFPVFGDTPVDEIGTEEVLTALKGLWLEKTTTASRVRSRIELVLDWAKVRGFRIAENPARWRGHLALLLPSPAKVAPTVHHPALDYREVPALIAELEDIEGVAARALVFTILTAARSSEARLAEWSEMDLEAGIWTVPARRMKNRREHRVPLSKPALALLEALPRVGDKVFYGTRYGGAIADSLMARLLKDLRPEATVHGLRSSFRDYCAEQTSFPRELAELALAHSNRNKTEASYLRSDLFEKRRALMNAWANWCYPAESSAVIALKR